MLSLPKPSLVVVGLLVALGGCASSLDTPIANELACKQLYFGLLDICVDGEVDFLNCDMMPGCNGGNVEARDVDECLNQIATATTCDGARAVQCAFAKLDCNPRTQAELFLPAIGPERACLDIYRGLTAAFSDCDSLKAADGTYPHGPQVFFCAQVLPCDVGGAFKKADLDRVLSDAVSKSTCAEALARIDAAQPERNAGVSEIEFKFCFEGVQ